MNLPTKKSNTFCMIDWLLWSSACMNNWTLRSDQLGWTSMENTTKGSAEPNISSKRFWVKCECVWLIPSQARTRAMAISGQVYRCAIPSVPRRSPQVAAVKEEKRFCDRCQVWMSRAKSNRMGVSTRMLRAISPVDLSNRNSAMNKRAHREDAEFPMKHNLKYLPEF